MANVLTHEEASIVLRCAIDDPNMLQSLPLVDEYLKQASGWDWTVPFNGAIDLTAKAAARMLLVQWHENPAQTGSGEAPLSFGLDAVLLQLKAKAIDLIASAA